MDKLKIGEKLLEQNGILGAVLIAIVSMVVVFATLVLLSLILKGFKTLFYKEDKKKPIKAIDKNTKPKEELVKEDNDDEELVAVIAAAIAQSLSRPVSDIRIKNITRVPQSTSAWAKAGIQEQTRNF
ncbi:OadG family protein [Dethiothermospora halolimnae]|uniref:OadG family protein n=1 Tax=Dethiothermospora halolimnae TaxID=3114390 RepID=UPI003CCBEAEC